MRQAAPNDPTFNYKLTFFGASWPLESVDHRLGLRGYGRQLILGNSRHMAYLFSAYGHKKRALCADLQPSTPARV